MEVGRVGALARFPVKSLGGEDLDRAQVEDRGLVGDRLWAVYTEDGGLGSGKTTRRFRRIDGLLELRAWLEEEPAEKAVPTIELPDGQCFRADDPDGFAALSDRLGRPLRLAVEDDVPHHDDSPLHLITTSGLRRLGELTGTAVSATPFRANVVVDVPGTGFVEDDWVGRELALGDEVVLRLGPLMPRCVMVGSRLLKTLGQHHEVNFGLQAHVVRPGALAVGDAAVLR